MSRFLIVILLVHFLASTALLAPPAHGQEVENHSPDQAGRAPAAGLILGGSVGAVGGLLLGSVIGEGLQTCESLDSEGDSCGFSGFTLGAFVGSTVGSVLGVQLAGFLFEDRPSIPASALGAVVGIAGGLVTAWGLYEWGDVDEFPLYIGFSLSQGAISGGIAALRPGSGRR